MLFAPEELPEKSDDNYLVFARKYRPRSFDELIGQDHIIDLFTNSFSKDRIAHAYILTGVRGVGKTTTARILAKGFNCLESERPTISPCGKCQNCISITDGKNIDVFEMDAASRTGIDDIREIIDSLPYKPLNCRYKVFIIDEVHMLSKSAFNGLLKTLEEPPGHVKFIFATTEIHKIPQTVLSRCQKIELKRVPLKILKEHFANICKNEDVTFDDEALGQIARAADGSVRDGLSLLDGAVSRGAGHISTKDLSDMLGANLADEAIRLIELSKQYKAKELLDAWSELYKNGIDPSLFIKELLYVTEWMVRAKHNPDADPEISFSEDSLKKGKKIASEIDFPILSRIWDIIFKASEDCLKAPDPSSVCDIMFMRMMYGLNMPDPNALKQPLEEETTEKKTPEKSVEVKSENNFDYSSFEILLSVLKEKRALSLTKILEMDCVVNSYSKGSFEIIPKDNIVINISNISKELFHFTGMKWEIKISQQKTQNTKTHREIKLDEKQQKIENAKEHPIVKKVFEKFPKAKITSIEAL